MSSPLESLSGPGKSLRAEPLAGEGSADEIRRIAIRRDCVAR